MATRRRPAPEPAESPLVAYYRARGDRWAVEHVESLDAGRVDVAAFEALAALDPHYDHDMDRSR